MHTRDSALWNGIEIVPRDFLCGLDTMHTDRVQGSVSERTKQMSCRAFSPASLHLRNEELLERVMQVGS